MTLLFTIPCKQCIRNLLNNKNLAVTYRLAHKYAQAEVKPNKYKVIYRDLHGSVDDDETAKDFVYALEKKERELLQIELQKFNVQNNIKDAEDRPTRAQLKSVSLHNALPFIGFGFLDNFLMILAGEYIEFKFGAMFGISTMAAAACGNLISDLAGVQTAHYIEVASSKFGVKAPALSPHQVHMSSTRWASNMGKAIGITIGCILGMAPLLFLEPRKKEPNPEAPPI